MHGFRGNGRDSVLGPNKTLKSFRHHAIAAALVVVCGSMTSGQLATTAPPAWRTPTTLTTSEMHWTPPGYTGSQRTAASFVPRTEGRLRVDGHGIFFSATSGTLAVHDKNGAASPSYYGVPIPGIDHIYHVSPDVPAGANGVLICGFCPDGSGAITKWTWTPGASPSTGTLCTIATVPSGAMLVRASVVGGSLFAFDLIADTIRRFEDPNQDGVFDVEDLSFAVTFPEPGTAPHLYPFNGFIAPKLANGVVGLRLKSPRSRPPAAIAPSAEIVVQNGTLVFASERYRPFVEDRVGIFGELTEGQTNVRVVAAANRKVQLRELSGPTPVALSLVALVPAGKTFVDVALLTPLAPGQSVEAVLADDPITIRSTAKPVNANHAILVEVPESLSPSETVDLTVFGYRHGDEVIFRSRRDGNPGLYDELPCIVRVSGPTTLRVTLPAYGQVGPPTSTKVVTLHSRRPSSGEVSAPLFTLMNYRP